VTKEVAGLAPVFQEGFTFLASNLEEEKLHMRLENVYSEESLGKLEWPLIDLSQESDLYLPLGERATNVEGASVSFSARLYYLASARAAQGSAGPGAWAAGGVAAGGRAVGSSVRAVGDAARGLGSATTSTIRTLGGTATNLLRPKSRENVIRANSNEGEGLLETNLDEDELSGSAGQLNKGRLPTIDVTDMGGSTPNMVRAVRVEDDGRSKPSADTDEPSVVTTGDSIRRRLSGNFRFSGKK